MCAEAIGKLSHSGAMKMADELKPCNPGSTQSVCNIIPMVAPAPRNPNSLEAALLSKTSAALAHSVEVANRFNRLNQR